MTHDEIEGLLDEHLSDPWAEVPGHPVRDWRFEVWEGNTRQGYRTWVYNRLANGE